MKHFVYRNRLLLLSAAVVILASSIWYYYARKHVFYDVLENEVKIASHLCSALKGSIITEMGRGNCSIENSQLTDILESIKDEVGLKTISIYHKRNCVNGDQLSDKLESFLDGKENVQFSQKILYFKKDIKMMPRHGKNIRASQTCQCNIPTLRKEDKRTPQINTIVLGMNLEPFYVQIDNKYNELTLQFLLILLLVLSIFFVLIRSHERRTLKLKLQQLELNQTRLEELQLIASGVAHETKNPLGIIRAIAQSMARKRDVTQEIVTLSEQIIDEADVTSERLSDFLHFAKMRQPECKWFSLKTFCEHRAVIFAPDMEEHGVHFSYETVDILLYTDESFLSQIMVNLLTNAIKACKAGDSIVLKMNENSIILEDSGCGIEPDRLTHIFKPYQQSRNGGHGIGLCMVKQLVDALNMKISIESEVGKGTKIIISELKCKQECK